MGDAVRPVKNGPGAHAVRRLNYPILRFHASRRARRTRPPACADFLDPAPGRQR